MGEVSCIRCAIEEISYLVKTCFEEQKEIKARYREIREKYPYKTQLDALADALFQVTDQKYSFRI